MALAIASVPRRLLSAASRVELTLVVEGRKDEEGRRKIAEFFAEIAIEVAPVTIKQAEFACGAFRRYGKGRHPTAGDCFAYAAAMITKALIAFPPKVAGLPPVTRRRRPS